MNELDVLGSCVYESYMLIGWLMSCFVCNEMCIRCCFEFWELGICGMVMCFVKLYLVCSCRIKENVYIEVRLIRINWYKEFYLIKIIWIIGNIDCRMKVGGILVIWKNFFYI